GLTRPLGHLAGRPVTVRNAPASNILRPHGTFSTRLTDDRRYCVINHDGAGNLEHFSFSGESTMRLPDRRRFLHDTAALAAALVALPAGSTRARDNEDSGLSETEGRAVSANDILRVG